MFLLVAPKFNKNTQKLEYYKLEKVPTAGNLQWEHQNQVSIVLTSSLLILWWCDQSSKRDIMPLTGDQMKHSNLKQNYKFLWLWALLG